MAALCIRPTDCLAGRGAYSGEHRGVRATPAPAPRRKIQQQKQDSQKPARGRANGRQRGRRSASAAGAGSPPHKRLMQNVVILKRAEEIPPGIQGAQPVAPPAAGQSAAQAEKAEAVAAMYQLGPQVEKPVSVAATEHPGDQTENELVTAAGQSGAEAEKAEPVVVADQRGPDTQAKKAEATEHRVAGAVKAEALAIADQSVPQTKKRDEPITAAYSGPWRPMQQQKDQDARLVCGLANGRQHRRPAPAAEGGMPPQKRLMGNMGNVLILNRGENIPPAPLTAGQSGTQAKKAPEPVASADQHGMHAEKAETLPAAGKSGAQANKAEPVAAMDQHGPGTQAAAQHRSADVAKAGPVAAAYLSVPQAEEEEDAPAPAEQRGAQTKEIESAARALYSGPPFVVAPEPRALPIPVLLLKPRGRGSRIRAPDDDRVPAPTAAAA